MKNCKSIIIVITISCAAVSLFFAALKKANDSDMSERLFDAYTRKDSIAL